MLDEMVSDSHMLFFFLLFFLQHVSLTLFHLCPAGFSRVLLALILGGTSKSHVFEKICIHLSLVSFQSEHPLRMHASSRFGLR